MKKQLSLLPFHENLQRVIELSEDELRIIDSYFEYIKVPRKTFLLSAGDSAKGFYYVLKGCCRSYAKSVENEHENILSFAVEDWWFANLQSWIQQEPSRYYIQAVEDSDLLFISYDNYEKLLSEVPKLEKYYRKLTQKGLAVLHERILDSLGKDATKRYLDFREKYGYLESRVAQHMIASYLGITPEFLSMIRNKLAKNKQMEKQ